MVGLWYAYVFSDVSGAMGRRHAPSRQSRPHIRTHKTKLATHVAGQDQNLVTCPGGSVEVEKTRP